MSLKTRQHIFCDPTTWWSILSFTNMMASLSFELLSLPTPAAQILVIFTYKDIHNVVWVGLKNMAGCCIIWGQPVGQELFSEWWSSKAQLSRMYTPAGWNSDASYAKDGNLTKMWKIHPEEISGWIWRIPWKQSYLFLFKIFINVFIFIEGW